MKLITSDKLKEGDWIASEKVFGELNKNGDVISKRIFAHIIKIKNKDDGKRDIRIKTWRSLGDKITKGGSINPYNIKSFNIYILNRKEKIAFKRLLILENLK